jgi:hypothetical protein
LPFRRNHGSHLTSPQQHKPLDIITLFHKAGSPASARVIAALRKASEAAAESSAANSSGRSEFQLDITEAPPTPDQLQTILGYVGRQGIPSVVTGANDEAEAMKKFKENVENFRRPVVCSSRFPFPLGNPCCLSIFVMLPYTALYRGWFSLRIVI